jgi:hypothetical protein
LVFIRKINLRRDHLKIRQKLAFIILILIFLDFSLTMIGQPKEYWLNKVKPDEANFIGKFLLQQGPIYFSIGVIFWALLNIFLIKVLSWFLVRILFLSLFLGHSLAIFSWLSYFLVKFLNFFKLFSSSNSFGIHWIFILFILSLILIYLFKFFFKINRALNRSYFIFFKTKKPLPKKGLFIKGHELIILKTFLFLFLANIHCNKLVYLKQD